MTKRRKRVTIALASAAAALAVILAISPHATIIADGASSEIPSVDILGITKNAKHLPTQQFPAV
jgi:hypothetical protein